MAYEFEVHRIARVRQFGPLGLEDFQTASRIRYEESDAEARLSPFFSVGENKPPLAQRGDSASTGVDRHDFAVAEGFDIAHGRLAEEPAVLAVELACALVADLEGGACGIEPPRHHAYAR